MKLDKNKSIIIVIAYFLISILYVLYSDNIILSLFNKNESHIISKEIKLYKELLFICFSAFTFYLLLKKKNDIINLNKNKEETSKKRLENSFKLLVNRENSLRKIGKIAKIGFWEYNLKEDTVIWSDYIYTIYGLNKNEKIPKQKEIENIFDEESRKKLIECNLILNSHGTPYDIELRLINVKNEEFWIRNIVQPIYNDTNEIIGRRGVLNDITSSKKLNLELETSLKSLEKSEYSSREAGKMAKIGYWAYDKQTDVISWSDAIHKIYGIPPKEGVPEIKEILNFFTEKSRKELIQATIELATKGIPYELELNLINAKNENIWIRNLGQPIYNETHEIIGRRGVSQDITAQKRAEEKIVQSKQRFKALVQEGSDLYAIIDKTGNYIYMSPSSISIIGIPPEEFIGKNAFEYLHPDDIESARESLKKIVTQDKVFMEHYRAKNHKNEWRWVETVLTNMLNNPAVKGIVVNSRDITEQVEEKQHLKLLESVITHTNDAVLITEAEPFDEPGPKIIYVNEAFTKMTGYDAADVIGKTPRILQGPKSDKEELAKLSKAIRNWEPCEITIVNYKKSGEEFWINFTVTPVADEKGWYTHWIAIERDVTESIEAKEKLIRAKEVAEENERKMKEAQKLAHLGSWYYDVINKVSYWSEETYNIWGLNPETATIDLVDHQKIVHPRDWERFNAVINDATEKGIPYKMELELIMPDGSSKIVNTIGEPIFNEKNKVIAFRGTTQDITERKTIENELISAKEKAEKSEYTMIQASKLAKIGYWYYNTDKQTLTWSDYIYKLYDLTPEDDIPNYEEAKGFFDSKSQEKITKATKELNENGTSYDLELRMINSKNEEFWVRNLVEPVYNDQNEIIGKRGIIQNITEEKSLRELNSDVAKMVRIGSWSVDLEKSTVFWSEPIHLLHETDSKSYVPNLEEGINFYREDFRQMVQSEVENTIKTGEAWDFEAVIVTAKKNEIWIRSIGNAEFSNGKCVRIYGGFQDIDKRKKYENRLVSLSENLPGIIYEYHIQPDGTNLLKNINGKVEEIWGFTPNEITDNADLVWAQIDAAGKMEEVNASIRKAIETKSRWQYQFKYMMPKTGKLHTHLAFGTPSFLADGTIMFNAIILDVTKEAKNEDLLEQTSKLARIGSWEMDLINQEGDSMYWSPSILDILEIDDKTYTPTLKDGIDFHVGESKERIKKSLQLLIEEGIEFDEEILLRTTKGNERWCRSIGKSEVINNVRVKIYGSYQDIHELKMANLSLKKNIRTLEDYKYSLDQSSIISFTNPKGEITSVNDNFVKISGYSKKVLIGNTHRIINANYHPKTFFIELWKTIASGKVWRGEIKNKAKDGSYYWVDTTIVPFLNEKNKPNQYLAIRFDVTERKRAEERLITTSEQLRLATTSAKLGIWDWDIVNDKLTWDYRMYELYGVKEEDFEGAVIAWKNGIHPDDVERASKDLYDAVDGVRDFKSVFRVVWSDKSIHYIEGTAIVSRDKEGNALRMIGGNIDVTDIKKVEQEILQAKEKIEASEAKFKSYTEKSPVAIYTTNADGDCNYVNETWLKISGMNTKEALGNGWLNALHPDDVEFVKTNWYKSIASKGKWLFEYRFINKINNEITWVEGTAKEMYNDKNELIGYLGTNVDITERKKAEDMYRLLANNTNDIIALQETDFSLTYISPAVETLLGYKPTELLDKKFFNVIHEEDIVNIKEVINKKLFKNITLKSITFRARHQKGHFIWLESLISPIIKENKIISIVSSNRDITESVNAKNKIQEYQTSLQRLTSEISLIEEKEKKQIAANIHDHLSQSLVISKMRVSDLQKNIELNNFQKDLEFIKSHISNALENSRKITYELSPPILYQLGIIDALDWFADETEEKYGIKFQFKSNVKSIKLSDFKSILIFRCVQEAVTNTIKYAEASLITLDFTKEKNSITVLLVDNGKGFDTSILKTIANSDSGFGLFAVKERIRNMNGNINIDSEINIGTKIKIFVPLE